MVSVGWPWRNVPLPSPAEDAWPGLIREAVRYAGDQETLPLTRAAGSVNSCVKWALSAATVRLLVEQLSQMLARREWREGYLADRMQDEILLEQILVEAEGERIEPVLRLVRHPSSPDTRAPLAEPSRISCVVHIGDGEFTDIERKAELGGNIHAKGMMIMQAFLMSELQLEQQIPFSASLTFEQSYSTSTATGTR